MESNRICAAILASGSSNRFGKGSKLVQHWNGIPLIDMVISAMARVHQISQIVVVVRPEDEELLALLSTRDVQAVVNASHLEGIGASIRSAVAASTGFDGLLICPADMPWLTTSSIQRLCTAWSAGGASSIAAAFVHRELRNPAIFGKDWYPKLMECSGDHGAKWILDANRKIVVHVDVPIQELEDIDLRSEMTRN